MRRILLTLLALSFVTSVSASEYSGLPHKNIKNNTKISVSQDGITWSKKFNKKSDIYYIKKDGGYFLPDGTLAFETEGPYIFLLNNRLIGCSSKDFKFYEYFIQNGQIAKKELELEELQSAFKGYKIINISEFSKNTNSLRIRKDFGNLNLIILNDTDKDFIGYSFTSGNAKFVQYPSTGILKVKKSGMIQLSKSEENSEDSPWYVLLIK